MAQNPCLGVVRVGRMEIAIPSDVLQEVVPGPLPLSILPGSAPFLLGNALVRGTPVPVLDLGQLLHPGEASESAGTILVVLATSQGRVAFQADELVTVVRKDAEDFCELSGAATGPETVVKKVFVEGARVVGLMDVESLIALPGVRASTQRAAISESGVSAEDELKAWILLRVDSLVVAIDIWAAVGARVIPEIQGAGLGSELVRGFFRTEDHETPLIHLHALLDLPRPESATPQDKMMAIQHDGRSLAFGITEVLSVERHSARSIRPVADSGLPRPELYRGTFLSRKHGQVFVLDHAAVLTHSDVAPVTAMPKSDDEADTTSDEQQGERSNYIVYRAGNKTFASLITEVESVQPFPADMNLLRRDAEAFLGFFQWREQTVPLVDLGGFLEAPTAEAEFPSARVLIVTGQTGPVGFLVQRVESLQMSVAKELPWLEHSASRVNTALPPFTRMIPIRDDSGRRNACLLDLRTVRMDPVPTAPSEAVA